MPTDTATCTYCGQTGLADWVKRRECCALAAAQQKAAYNATFNEFAGQWLQDNLTVAEILSTPGVAELLLEANHNAIQEAFDEQDEDDNPPYDDTHRKQNFCQDDRDPMHSGA